MRPSTKRLMSLAAAVIAASCLPPGQARAGLVIKMPQVVIIGDPTYIYTAQVFWEPGDTFAAATGPSTFSNPVNPVTDDYLTIYNIRGFSDVIGFTPNPILGLPDPSGFAVIARQAGMGYTPPGVTPPPVDPDPDTADLTLYRVVNSTTLFNNSATESLLGTLRFRAFLPEGVPYTTDLVYSFQDHNGGNPSRGTATIAVSVVPEPSSFALLGLGGLAAWRSRLLRRSRKGVSDDRLATRS